MKVIRRRGVITGQIVQLLRQFRSILVSLRIEMNQTDGCILVIIQIGDIFQTYLNLAECEAVRYRLVASYFVYYVVSLVQVACGTCRHKVVSLASSPFLLLVP